MKIKALLYCTKAKPYLEYKQIPRTLMEIDNSFEGYRCSYKSTEDDENFQLNGKIVAECDFEVEEIFGISRGTYQPDKYDFKWEDRILNGACLTNDQINDYIPHYAIHIKNLHIFDEPKKTSEYKRKDEFMGGKQVFWKTIKKAPQNMMYAYDNECNKYVLISIQPQWMCLILNGEKTIEIRKKVLKEMLK